MSRTRVAILHESPASSGRARDDERAMSRNSGMRKFTTMNPSRPTFRVRTISLALTLLVLATSIGRAADKPLVKTTHVSKTVGDVKVEADVSRPEGAEARPVVVWIHGGALIVGSRSPVPPQILE